MSLPMNGSRAFALCIAILSTSIAAAAPVFSNFGPSQSYDITQGVIIGNDFVGDNLAEGSTFTPSASATFGSLSIALSCASVCPDFFTVTLSSDSGADFPGASIESFTRSGVFLGALGTPNAPLVFNSLLSPLLTAGSQYWITVTSNFNDSIVWNANLTGDTSDQAISTDGGASWFSPSGLTPGAFEVDSIEATVPEPSSLALGGLGLAAALGIAGRRGRGRRFQAG